MAPASIDARLRYLDSISKKLLVSSPAVSAHLQTTRYAHAEIGDIPQGLNDNGRVCKACGNILIMGWSCGRLRNRNGSRREAKKPGRTEPWPNEHNRKDLPVRCEKCNAVSRIQIMTPRGRQYAIDRVLEPCSTGGRPEPANKPLDEPKVVEMEKRPSRKRPRNKGSTLQSLLKATQTPTKAKTAGGYGLDLRDLMAP